MYLTLIILPLLGSIASGLFGRKIGVIGSQLITTSLVVITTILAIFVYLEVGLNSIPVSIQLFRWIDSESLIVYWGFQFDSLTTSMLLPVLFVSSLVHIYSMGYMKHDPQYKEYICLLFTYYILVTVYSYWSLFLGYLSAGEPRVVLCLSNEPGSEGYLSGGEVNPQDLLMSFLLVILNLVTMAKVNVRQIRIVTTNILIEAICPILNILMMQQLTMPIGMLNVLLVAKILITTKSLQLTILITRRGYQRTTKCSQ